MPRRLLLFFLLVTTACIFVRCQSAPEDSPLPTPESITRHFDSPEYGVQAFMWWRQDVAWRDLDRINEMGFGWVKQEISWREIEAIEKGKYDWYRPDNIVQDVENAGLKLIVRLDRQPFWSQPAGTQPLDNIPPANLDDFGDFCEVLATRYKGRIHAYQIWNEPNLSREWGHQTPDPSHYTDLLAACYTRIKSVDPEAIIISAGLAPTGTHNEDVIPDTDYLQAMYAAGAADYFDVLGLNAPGYKAPPEVSPLEGENTSEYGSGRWFVFRRVEDMRRIMIENGDGHKQVAILEMGWTTDQVNPNYAWHAVTPEEQAEYLTRAYAYARDHWDPWIGLMVTIYMADYDWTPEYEQYWWAITDPDGTPRPAFEALKAMEK